MKKKPKLGRPKLPKGKAQTAVITLRMSKEDRAKIAAAVKASRQRLSEWARAALLAAADRIIVSNERKAEELNPGAGISSVT